MLEELLTVLKGIEVMNAYQKLAHGHHSQSCWGQWGDVMTWGVGHRPRNSRRDGHWQTLVEAGLT